MDLVLNFAEIKDSMRNVIDYISQSKDNNITDVSWKIVKKLSILLNNESLRFVNSFGIGILFFFNSIYSGINLFYLKR